MKVVKRLLVLIGILLVLFQVPYSCAQRGTPSGGPKDSIPPVFVSSSPENYSTQFKAKTVRINFDEYIKLDDASKQILISPPGETRPIIKPQGQALRYVEIEFLDTLKENTTYSVNFGRSIEDNNEGNVLPYFKYVFSTGDYIDSLEVRGWVKDAYERETKEGISVMLYKLDSTYSDSIVFKEPPRYVAYARDSTNSFFIENAEEGDYKIVAIKDKNQNYKYDKKREKIGFLSDTIHLPTDREYNMEIFKEILDYKPKRLERLSKRHFLFPFEGNPDSVEIRLLSDKPADFRETHFKRVDHDSIDYWMHPGFDAEEVDSLVFEVKRIDQRDTLMTRIRDAQMDSLKVSSEPGSNLPLIGVDFELSANTPLTKIDTSLIRILNKDSLEVPYKTTFKEEGNKYIFDFKKEEKETYSITALPGALMDFYEDTNDTLQYSLRTKGENEYADVILNLQNIETYPVIVQLTDNKGETKRELIHHEKDGSKFNFRFVNPGKYFIRVVYDENDNGVWDTGDYLRKKQPEKVIYMKEPLDVRKNWEVTQTFILKN